MENFPFHVCRTRTRRNRMFYQSFVTTKGCGIILGTCKLAKVHILAEYEEEVLGFLFLLSRPGLFLNLLLGSVYVSCE